MVVADGMICQMMEPVVLPEMQDYKVDYSVKTWAANGHGMSKPHRAIINSLYINTDELDVLNERLQATYREIEANEVRYEAYNLEGRGDRLHRLRPPSRASPRAPSTT